METDEVKLELDFAVSPERLWQALTDIHEMKQWYFPMLENFRAEPGFETVFMVHNEGKDYPHRWKVTEVMPGKRLAYSWSFDGYPGNSLLIFELSEIEAGAKLRFTHRGLRSFQPEEYPQLSKQNFETGWNQIIGKSLRLYLEQHPAFL